LKDFDPLKLDFNNKSIIIFYEKDITSSPKKEMLLSLEDIRGQEFLDIRSSMEDGKIFCKYLDAESIIGLKINIFRYCHR
jgi:hypothetical protein